MATEKDDVGRENTRKEALLHLCSDHGAMASAYGGASFETLFKDRHVLGVACFAAVGGLLFGIDQGLMSVTLVMPRFVEKIPEIDPNGGTNAGFHKGLLTAMIELGAFLGAIFASFVADHYSRRNSIRVGASFFLLGSAIQTGSSNFDTLIAGRLIGGIGVGFLSMTCPLYISEISPPNLRGILLSTEEGAIVSGIVLAYYVTYGTRLIPSDWSFRLPFLLQIVPGLALLCGSFLLPASPRWLAMKGRNEECLTTLAKLRSRPVDDLVVQAEWLGIQSETQLHQEIQKERHPNLQSGSFKDELRLDGWAWLDTWRPGCWKRTLIGILLTFFQQFLGINALIYYAPTLFEQLGLNYNDRLVQAGISNVCQLVGVLMSFFLIDKIGRKPLLIFGSFATMVCMMIVSVLTALYGSSWPTHQADAKAAIAFLNIYMVVFGVSWGPIPWAMPSELFPSSLRARGVAWSVMGNWFFNFIIGLIVPPMVSSTGYGTFVFFAVFAFLSGLFSIFMVPETMGKTLEQLDVLFDDQTGTSDQDRRNRINTKLAQKAAQSNGQPLGASALFNTISHEKTEGSEDAKESSDGDLRRDDERLVGKV